MTRGVRKGRTCEVCGSTYNATYSAQRTCGRACGATITRRPTPKPKVKPEPKGRFTPVKPIDCPCGARVYVAKIARLEMCKPCALKHYRKNDKRRLGERQTECVVCQASITYKGGTPWYCSDTCRRSTTHWKEQRRDAKRRRRALKRAAQVDHYTDREIFERDRWTCRLCLKRVYPDARVPHPKAPTIDHVIPLACGGDDTRANVQCACFECNTRKGTRGSQQLALVG